VGLEGLFSELLVTTVFYCVDFEPVGVAVNEMVLCEQVRHWVESADNAKHHCDDNFGVGNLTLCKVG
jgi:hypothetical protein